MMAAGVASTTASASISSRDRTGASVRSAAPASVGEYLEQRWSNVATHRPSEFNRAHVPSCFAGFAPLP